MIDIEKEAKEIEESQPGKEEVDEDIKPAELEGNEISIRYWLMEQVATEM